MLENEKRKVIGTLKTKYYVTLIYICENKINLEK